MSFEPETDSVDHELEIESGNDQIISLLRAAVFLLEIIANVEPGTTIDNSGD